MALKDIRPRHIYVASAAAFVLLAGFEGARMAAGHDPALAASGHARPAATVEPYRGGGFAEPDDPDAQSGPTGSDDGGQVPQPESRLS
jgi:hypothetical protein